MEGRIYLPSFRVWVRPAGADESAFPRPATGRQECRPSGSWVRLASPLAGIFAVSRQAVIRAVRERTRRLGMAGGSRRTQRLRASGGVIVSPIHLLAPF